jgi:hypothetical protein
VHFKTRGQVKSFGSSLLTRVQVASEGGIALVEQSTHNPKSEGSDPVAIGTGMINAISKLLLGGKDSAKLCSKQCNKKFCCT